MAEKVWLKSYPPHVPATIDDKPYSSIADLFTQAARKYADRGAFSNLGLTITYRELDRLSDQFATFLQGLPGMQKGDRVALMMPNLETRRHGPHRREDLFQCVALHRLGNPDVRGGDR